MYTIYTYVYSNLDIGAIWVHPYSARMLMIIDMLVWIKVPVPAMVLVFSPAMRHVPN